MEVYIERKGCYATGNQAVQKYYANIFFLSFILICFGNPDPKQLNVKTPRFGLVVRIFSSRSKGRGFDSPYVHFDNIGNIANWHFPRNVLKASLFTEKALSHFSKNNLNLFI